MAVHIMYIMLCCYDRGMINGKTLDKVPIRCFVCLAVDSVKWEKLSCRKTSLIFCIIIIFPQNTVEFPTVL